MEDCEESSRKWKEHVIKFEGSNDDLAVDRVLTITLFLISVLNFVFSTIAYGTIFNVYGGFVFAMFVVFLLVKLNFPSQKSFVFYMSLLLLIVNFSVGISVLIDLV